MDTTVLVVMTCQGNTEAFEELVEKYWRFAVGIAFNYVGHLADAEDIAQDAFIAAYSTLRRLKDGAKFAAWLRGIIANYAKMHVRGRHSVPKGLNPQEYDGDDGTGEVDSSPERHMLRKELSEQINGTLSSLPDNYREVAVLRYLSEMSYRRIAEALDLPAATVSYRLRHANALMRKELEKFMNYGKFDDTEKQSRTRNITRILELVTQGCDLARKRDLDSAENAFNEASRVAHDNPSLHMEIANRLLQTFIQDGLDIRVAVKIESELECAHSGGLANLYWTDGTPMQSWDAYAGLALLYVHLREFVKAREMFDKAKALGQPYDLNEGQWFGNQGLYTEQISFYRDIFEKHGCDGKGSVGELCRFCIASGLTDLECYDEALDEYRSLISEGVDPAFSWYMAAYVHALRNDDAKFLEAVSKAVECDPSFAEKAKAQGVFAKYRGLADFRAIVG